MCEYVGLVTVGIRMVIDNVVPVILAAGQGKRMCSDLPKVLSLLGGKPLIVHVLMRLLSMGFREVCIVCDPHSKLQTALTSFPIRWVIQPQPKGTGDALKCVLRDTYCSSASKFLVIYGDTPLVSTQTLTQLMAKAQHTELVFLSTVLSDPSGYGRVIRTAGKVVQIVEEKDATPAQRAIEEINSGIFIAHAQPLRHWIASLTCQNQSHEFYLTDIFGLATQAGFDVAGLSVHNTMEVIGVNTSLQLCELERLFQRNQAQQLAEHYGVKFCDIDRFDLRGELKCGRNVSIDANVCLEGNVILGDNVQLGIGVILKDSTIQSGSNILPYSILEGVCIGENCSIGPFARLRPGTFLAEETKIGNFVEVKATQIGARSKVNHLSYLGDSSLGTDVNIGAGVVTCNYDGTRKHQTVIGSGSFIGSNSALVAPLSIGESVLVGANSTVTKPVTAHSLVTSRIAQKQVKRRMGN